MVAHIHQALLFGNLQTWLRQADCILGYTERSNNFTFSCESVLLGYDAFHCSLKMSKRLYWLQKANAYEKQNKKKNPILCACKEREHQTVEALSIVLNYAGLLEIQYQEVSKLLQSNKSAIRLRFVSRSRNKQTNKHKSVVFLAASYCSQCPTGPNGPKVGQIYYIERLLFND